MKNSQASLLGAGLAVVFTNACAPISSVIRPAPQDEARVCSYRPGLDNSPHFSEIETSIVVKGDTTQALQRSLQTIRSVDTKKDMASTNWSVRWDFDWRVSSTGCKITSAIAGAEINYQFPVWPQQLNTNNRQLVSRWTSYSDKLRARHCSYGEFGIQAAIEIEQALKAISPRRSCTRLEKDANELARNIVGQYKELEQKFRGQTLINAF